MIRHADAHVAVELNKKEDKVNLLNVRGKKTKLIRTYTFEDITRMTSEVSQELFPAIFISLSLQEI